MPPLSQLRLPDRFEINEFSTMQQFFLSLENNKGETLIKQLGGRGSFQRFKQTLGLLDLTEQWHMFKATALKQVAMK